MLEHEGGLQLNQEWETTIGLFKVTLALGLYAYSVSVRGYREDNGNF